MKSIFTILVRRDLFDIVNRIKKVDTTYYVLFNKKTKNYEIHSNMQKGSTLCFIVGKKLNAQAIVRAQKTKIKFLKNIINDINDYNKYLEDKSNQAIQDYYRYKLANYADWANKKNCDVDFSNLDKTTWI